MKGIIGKKLGMTQIFDEAGRMIPVTLIEAGPCFVTQVRTAERDGYSAVQLGFGEVKSRRLSAGQRGHLQKSVSGFLRYLREFPASMPEGAHPGDRVTVEVFQVGERVDVVGTSKGKGFQGGVKRHHFSGGPKTHGQSDRLRAPGAVGSTTDPGRIYKGKRMAGHMGAARVTSQSLRVAMVDGERNLLGVEGSVPGARGSIVSIQQARKQ
jgi:large subunit ribosomal protein L3